MSIIHKTISMDCFKSRLGTRIPAYVNGELVDSSYEGYSDWGKIPMDIEVSFKKKIDDEWVEQLSYSALTSGNTYNYNECLSEIADKLPLDVSEFTEAEGEFRRYVLRYKVMTTLFGHLLNFIRNCRYYQACKRGDGYKWVEFSEMDWANEGIYPDIDGKENLDYDIEKFFLNISWIFYGEVPSPEEAEEAYPYENARYICVNEDYEWLVNTFRDPYNTNRYEECFYHFVLEMMNEDNDLSPRVDGENGIVYSEPYLPIDVYISEKVKDIGLYKSDVEDWIPNKRYYLGQRVHYSIRPDDPLGSTYELVNGDTYESIEINEDIYFAHENSDLRFYYYQDNDKYYVSIPYYKGNYDQYKQVTYFDILDEDGNVRIINENGDTYHWKKCIESDQPLSKMLYGDGESHLIDFESILSAYDDDNNKLPFILDSANTNNTEFNYRVGPMENGDRVDVLSSITLYNELHEMQIPESDPVTANDESVSTCSYIKFVYYLGTTREINYQYGIKHTEMYKYDIKELSAPVKGACAEYIWTVVHDTDVIPDMIVSAMTEATSDLYKKVYKYEGDDDFEFTVFDNETQERVPLTAGMTYICYPLFQYIDVDYSMTYTYDSEFGYLSDDGVVSHIEYDGILVENDAFQETPIFTTDYLMGFCDVKEKLNINVERGTSSATERHMALSEVNTYQDLEEYKNDMFKLRDQNT